MESLGFRGEFFKNPFAELFLRVFDNDLVIGIGVGGEILRRLSSSDICLRCPSLLLQCRRGLCRTFPRSAQTCKNSTRNERECDQ